MNIRIPFQKKNDGEPEPQPLQPEEISVPPETMKFTLFGITLQVPGTWLAYPQQNRERISWASGALNIEDSQNRMEASSLGIQWEARDTTPEQFLEDYPRDMEQQYSRRIKKNAEFVLLRNEILETNDGKKVCLLCCEYRASSSMLGKSKLTKISIMNTAFYCTRTRRIITGTIVARPNRMEELQDRYQEMLLGIISE